MTRKPVPPRSAPKINWWQRRFVVRRRKIKHTVHRMIDNLGHRLGYSPKPAIWSPIYNMAAINEAITKLRRADMVNVTVHKVSYKARKFILHGSRITPPRFYIDYDYSQHNPTDNLPALLFNVECATISQIRRLIEFGSPHVYSIPVYFLTTGWQYDPKANKLYSLVSVIAHTRAASFLSFADSQVPSIKLLPLYGNDAPGVINQIEEE